MKKSNKQPLAKWKGQKSNARNKVVNENILTAGNNPSCVEKNILASVDVQPEETMQLNKSRENLNSSSKDHREEISDNEEKENNWVNHATQPKVVKKVQFREELSTELALSEGSEAADVINKEMQLQVLAPPVPVSDGLEKQFSLGPGDVVWAYIPGWPLWPGIISINQEEGVHLKSKGVLPQVILFEIIISKWSCL